MTFVWKDFLNENVTFYHAAIVIGLILCVVTVIMTSHLIYKHFKYYCQPDHQRYIVRIIFMIPIYSIFTILSIIFHQYEIYFALARDCYESYVIYSFFALLISYGGGDSNLVTHFIAHEPVSLSPFKQIQYLYKPSEKFLQISRIFILQYVIIKPLMAILVIILTVYDRQGNSLMQFNTLYPYNMTITFVSVGLALYFVMLFLKISHDEVSPFKPVLKFLSIKILIGLIFWQYMALIALDYFGMIPESHEFDSDELLVFICNCLILIEMLFCAILHFYAYPYELYRVMTLNSAPLLEKNFHKVGSIFNNVAHSIKQTDMIEETIKSIKGTNIYKKDKTKGKGKGKGKNENYDGLGDDEQYDEDFDIAPIEMGEFQKPQQYNDKSAIIDFDINNDRQHRNDYNYDINGGGGGGIDDEYELDQYIDQYIDDFEKDPDIINIINSSVNNKNNITSIGVHSGNEYNKYSNDDSYLSDDFFFSMMSNIKSNNNNIEQYNENDADNHEHMVKIKR
ncbi:hypothetical protein ACTFIW_010362 [Dictyostelium discoideum]